MRLRRLAPILVGCAATAIWAGASELFTGAGLYSTHGAYRLQTEAFLAGGLSVGPSPYHLGQDAIWSETGAHQNWGLGVPLLRLPFEILARPFAGTAGFPDRLVLLFFHAFAGAMLWSAWGRAAASLSLSGARSLIAGALLIALTVVHPALVLIARTHFAAYEEAVTYGCLSAFVSFALLVRTAVDPGGRALLFLALSAGLGGVIRPTLHFIGAVAFALGLLAVWRGARERFFRRAALAALLYAIGPVFVLVTNQLRFGDPLEMGYALSQSANPPNDLALRFDYPFRDVPIGEAALELFSFLFFATKPAERHFYAQDVFPGQSAVMRFREIYFQPYDAATAVLLALALAAPLFLFVRREGRRDLLVSSWAFGLGSVVVIASFYLRAPSLTSRYLLDFLPGFAALAWSLFLALDRLGRTTFGAILIGGALAFNALTHPKIAEGYDPRLVTNRWPGWESASREGPPLPAEIRCSPSAPAPGDRRGIKANLDGWSHERGCAVHFLTTVFLPWSSCYELEIEPGPELDLAGVAVKDMGELLERRSTDRPSSVLRFCSKKERSPPPAPGTPAFTRSLSIRWIDPRDPRVSWERYPSVRLLAVRSAR